MTKKRVCGISFALAIVMVLSMVFTVPIQAAGTNEVLPIVTYNIGGFTFTDTNLTPTKIPAGRYITVSATFKKASIDAGLGNVKLSMNIRDAYTGQVISKTYVQPADATGQNWVILLTDKIDLGYANRPIQIWFDASSTGASNGNYRSIEVQFYGSTVSN